MIDTSEANLVSLIQELVKEGEDERELTLWLDIYDGLEKDEREVLVTNLRLELEQLQRLKGKID